VTDGHGRTSSDWFIHVVLSYRLAENVHIDLMGAWLEKASLTCDCGFVSNPWQSDATSLFLIIIFSLQQ